MNIEIIFDLNGIFGLAYPRCAQMIILIFLLQQIILFQTEILFQKQNWHFRKKNFGWTKENKHLWISESIRL